VPAKGRGENQAAALARLELSEDRGQAELRGSRHRTRGAPMVSINSAGGRAAGARAAPGGEMTYPHLDKPGRCAWCGGPVSPGERFCSRYCGRARSAWSNVPFSESLGEELTPREPEQPRTVDTPGGPPLNR